MVSIDEAVNAILALIHRWNLPQFLYNWQTLIAGVLAVLAAWRTIRATTQSADREVKASQDQTAVAQKEIETTINLARKRDETEFDAFRTLLEAAMTRVLAEVAWAKKTYPQFVPEREAGVSSPEALAVRRCITKGGFAELRSACVTRGGPWTREFLYLEGEIDNFAAQWEGGQSLIRAGKHAGLSEQLDAIEAKANDLCERAKRDRYGEPPWRSEPPATPRAAPPGR
jgi:hypothetical protein